MLAVPGDVLIASVMLKHLHSVVLINTIHADAIIFPAGTNIVNTYCDCIVMYA